MKRKTKVPQSLKNIDLSKALRQRNVHLQLKVNKELVELAKPIIKQQRAKKKLKAVKQADDGPQAPRRCVSFTNEQVEAYWTKHVHLVDVIEEMFQNKLKQYIELVTKQFLVHLDVEVNSKKTVKGQLTKLASTKDYFTDNEDDLVTKAQLDFTPLLQNLAVLSGQEANKLIGISDPYLPIDFRKQIEANVTRFTKSMLSTDREKLIGIIEHGVSSGQSVPDIRAQIVSDFDEYSKMQAELITRTEVIRVSNQAALDAYEQSGVVEGKQWVTFGATDECQSYDGQIVTLNNSFYSSDSEFQDGDPPLHPNCRCVLVPIVTS